MEYALTRSKLGHAVFFIFSRDEFRFMSNIRDEDFCEIS